MVKLDVTTKGIFEVGNLSKLVWGWMVLVGLSSLVWGRVYRELTNMGFGGCGAMYCGVSGCVRLGDLNDLICCTWISCCLALPESR